MKSPPAEPGPSHRAGCPPTHAFAGAALGLAYDGSLAPVVVGVLLRAAGSLIAHGVATMLTADAALAVLPGTRRLI